MNQSSLEVNLVDGSRPITLGELRSLPTPVSKRERLFPVPHEFLVNETLDAILSPSRKVTETRFSLSHEDHRLVALLKASTKCLQFANSWVIAFTNANDGTDGITFYTGAVNDFTRCIAFHHKIDIVVRHTEESIINLPASIAASIRTLEEVWNINAQRIDAYNKLSLTRADAHDIFCRVIANDIMAGREINALLNVYHNSLTQFKKGTLWKAYQAIVLILSKLKLPQHIERTIKLTEFSDSLAEFSSRPTPYFQDVLFKHE